MIKFQIVTTVFCLAALSTIVAPLAQADTWNRKTEITFSEPVEIPGVHLAGWGVLPAGTYVFKILDSQSDRHIVQIFSKDEKTVYATILAIPNFRLQATDKTVITFKERPAGQPEALGAWFYPGRNWGEEFVYPKAKAMLIAKAENRTVLFMPTEMPLEVSEPAKLAEAPMVAELKRTPVMAVNPAGEEVQLAEVVTAPPVEVAASPVATDLEPRALPATASGLPTFGLFGLIAFGAAFAVVGMAKRP
jgi:hypothetical protein